MYTAYNLSRAVYERIQLQNAADATAYSLATLEARTFNFIAFSNRAQVANYVQMMESQAMLSSATWLEGFAGVLATLELAGVTGASQLYEMVKPVVDNMVVWHAQYLRLQTAKNYTYFVVAAALVAATAMQLSGGGPHMIAANDPDARQTILSRALNFLNVASFLGAFDPGALGLGNAQTRARAKRVMAELANASRYGSTHRLRHLIVSRSPFDLLVSAVGVGANSSVVGEILGAAFDGTTKLLTARPGELPNLEDTNRNRPEHSYLSGGGAMASKDQVAWSLLSPNEFASVRATPTRSAHCRFFMTEGIRCVRETERDLRWRGPGFGSLSVGKGITPYFRFAAKTGGIQAQRRSFNQPDVWIFLNKRPEAMQPGEAQQDLVYDPDLPGGPQDPFDARIGAGGLLESGLSEGLNVLARAQVYYHRPGAWQEPPNFFNPYWGARLAPKNVAIRRLTGALEERFGGGEIVGALRTLIDDNIWLH